MNLQCWKCGEPLKDIILPFSRFEECSFCNADQHVCLLCKEYDASVADSCREDRADFVLDKEKANFCDYFKPRPGAFQKRDDQESAQARARLADLFGEEAEPSDHASTNDSTLSESEKALAELNRLFGDE